MQSRPTKFTIKVGGKVHEITPSTTRPQQEPVQKDVNNLDADGPSVPSNSNSNNKGTDHKPSSPDYSTDDEDTDSRKQMVIYDPSVNNTKAIEAVENHHHHQHRKTLKPPSFSRTLLQPRNKIPEVGAFTVQCAKCSSWRLIPDQEKYEDIRENITDQPFVCETALEWNRNVSCKDPTDLKPDGSRIWAIDKPDIAKPPPGWKRLLRLRSEGSSKFADVYYVSPDGAKFRSMPEVSRYLENNMGIIDEVEKKKFLARFSFQIPKPLDESYVRKRPATQTPAAATPEIEAAPVEPLSWVRPEEPMELQIAEPLAWAIPSENRKTPKHDPMNLPPKKARTQGDFL